VTVYEKSLKRTKAVIKVPTQFVGTAYKKSLIPVWLSLSSSHIQSP
jgi:hypothetical protein